VIAVLAVVAMGLTYARAHVVSRAAKDQSNEDKM